MTKNKQNSISIGFIWICLATNFSRICLAPSRSQFIIKSVDNRFHGLSVYYLALKMIRLNRNLRNWLEFELKFKLVPKALGERPSRQWLVLQFVCWCLGMSYSGNWYTIVWLIQFGLTKECIDKQLSWRLAVVFFSDQRLWALRALRLWCIESMETLLYFY